MLFDTDILIWVLRGDDRAARLVDQEEERLLSVISYLELIQGARDKNESRKIKNFLSDAGFLITPLSENIGHRASIYIEEYGLKQGMRVADALIAATAVENQLSLCTANQKHYQAVKELDLKIFQPSYERIL